MTRVKAFQCSTFKYLYLFTFISLLPACSALEATSSDAGQSPSVLIHFGSEAHSIELSQYAETIEGLQQAHIANLVNAAFPEINLENTSADFLAADGFMPGDSPNCEALMPVAASSLQQAYVDVDTRTLSWDEALLIPGCLYINDLSEIFLTTP